MTASSGQAVSRGADFSAWSCLAAAIVVLNAGNLLLDRVAKAAGVSLELFLSPTFLLAIGCLGLAFVLYVRSLARLPLAVAYPVMVGVSMIVVAVANHLWGAAPLSVMQMAGVLALFSGVAIISTAPRAPVH